MPKSFVFTTLDDGIVPHENSLRLIKAFEDNHIEYEFHMFPKGIHGCSLADERVYKTRDVTPNMKLLREWVNLVSISLELYGFTTID